MSFHARALAAVLVCAGYICGASTAIAQLPDEGRKMLAYYVGTWRYTSEVEGEEYQGTWWVTWSPDESCLLSHWSGTGPDGLAKGTKITGWDTAKHGTVDLDCADSGEYTLARYSIESDTVEIGEGEGSTPDGKRTRSKLRVEKKRDRFTWTVSERRKGDARLPDLVFVFEKVSDSRNTVSKSDYEEFRAMFTGRWAGEVKWVADWPGLGKKGDVATCYLDVDQVEDGNAMVGKFYGGAGSGTILWAYDAGARTIHGTVVYSGGIVSQVRYFKEGDQWVETVSGTLPDGRKTQSKSTLTWDGQSLRAQGHGTIDGKPNDPRDDKWQRLHP